MSTKTLEKILLFSCNLGFFFAIRVRKPAQFIFHGGFANCKGAGYTDADEYADGKRRKRRRMEIDIFISNEFRVVSLVLAGKLGMQFQTYVALQCILWVLSR